MGLRKGQAGQPVKTFDLKDFAGGWDLREGLYSREQNRFTDLLNVYVTVGKKIKRRPPLTKSAGAYDTANAQGLIYVGGRWYSIAKKGSPPAHTVAAISINTLLFDNPDYCTTWTLTDYRIFNNVVCAIIKHDFPGATMTSRYMLHVFDGKAGKPTYVEDPACPTNWGPTFPLGLYGTQIVGAPDTTYVPTMGVGGNHLWISRPDGNPACSKVNNPRAWNQRSVDDLLDGGEWWYFVIPNNGAYLRQFTVSEDGATIVGFRTSLDQKFIPYWSAYVLEYLDANGAWQKFQEDASGTPAVDKHYRPTTVASRFGAGTEIQLNVFWTGATDVVIRWRAIAGAPPVKIVTGCTWDTATLTLTGGTIQFEGNNYTVAGEVIGAAASTDGTVAPGGLASYFYYIGVGPPIAAPFTHPPVNTDAAGGYKTIKAIGGTITGFDRYYARLINWDFEDPATPSSATGLFVYPGDTGKENAWYLSKLSDYTVNQAGFGEASFLNTQNNNPNGGYLKAMGNLLKQMIFSYDACTQLWIVSANPANDDYQTKVDIGTGTLQTRPVAVNFYDLVMLPTPTGLRGFNMQQGLLVNSLQDNNVGEPITGADLADLTAACWWPFLGTYITAGLLGGSVQWYVLSESRESEISAWSRWTAAGITSIEAMVPLQDRLYIKSGAGIYYFDGSRTITENGRTGTGGFRDSNDPAGDGNAYASSGRWHFNDMQRPGSEKDYVSFDVVQIGVATWDFGFFPTDLTARSASGPVAGTSAGLFPYSLGFAGSGISPGFNSTDETGFQLEGLSIDFAYLGRG